MKKLVIADNGEFDVEKFQMNCYRNRIVISMKNIKQVTRGAVGKDVRHISSVDAKRSLKDCLKPLEQAAKEQGFELRAGKALAGVPAFIIYKADNPRARYAEILYTAALFTVYEPAVVI